MKPFSTLHLFGLAVLIHVFVSGIALAQSSSAARDREVLVEFYEATDGPNWSINTNWLSDSPLSDWYGVNTDRDGRVVSLYLKGGANFVGPKGLLPPSITELSELSSLSLGRNQLHGEIPAAIGKLTELRQLDLEQNDLTGPIPAGIGSLSHLTSLRLANNEFTGWIPKELFELEKLQTLDLGGNAFTGPIPDELGNLTRLRTLHIDFNQFFGHLPESLGNLTELRSLNIDQNNLWGPLPTSIGNLTQLTELTAWDNNLSGEIPASLSNLVELEELILWRNRFSGNLPDGIRSLTKLQTLDLAENQFSGWIHREVSQLKSLVFLDLSSNRFTGPVIRGLRHLPELAFLLLGNNELSGPLPTRFVDADSILVFGIAGNQVCVPGTHSFIYWLSNVTFHDISTLHYCNAVDRDVLEDLFTSADGESWINSRGWLEAETSIERWYGVQTNSLGQVTSLVLADNGLTGSLPPGMGNLSALKRLNLANNALTGRVPISIRRLALEAFEIEGTDLCIPGDLDFQAWLDGTETHSTPDLVCEALTELDVLLLIHEQTDGENWIEAADWQTDAPIDDWYGVDVDEAGRVIGLDLRQNELQGMIPFEIALLPHLKSINFAGNSLTGLIPAEIAELKELTTIDLSDNEFIGEIPSVLGSLENLAVLNLSGNQLTGTIPIEFADLPKLTDLDIGVNSLTGSIPPELGRLTNLKSFRAAFNDLTGTIPSEIASLYELESLSLNNNRLRESIPNAIGELTSLRTLRLNRNQLSGEIPTELGQLTNLSFMDLEGNQLTGVIPASLANLSKLTWLSLAGNDLEGEITRELGDLSELESLSLQDNELSGAIPAEIGKLSNLLQLNLAQNVLNGGIPSEIGDLSALEELILSNNSLSGPIPPAIGDAVALQRLYLSDNDLEGSIPPELGNLVNLEVLQLSGNRRLSGPLPIELTNLTRLGRLTASATDICRPNSTEFNAWLSRMYGHRIRSCDASGPLLVHLTQSIQSHEFPVPLVAGERAMLRLFPAALDDSFASFPAVDVQFFVDDQEIYTIDEPATITPLLREAGQGELSSSMNLEIPGEVIRPGLEMVLEFENETEGATSRLPETGRIAIEVNELPPFELTLIPFVQQQIDDQTDERSIVDLVNAVVREPETHSLFADTRTLLPVKDLELHAHEPVINSTNDFFDILLQTAAIHAIEGGDGYYMALMPNALGGIAGIAFLAGTDSVSITDSAIIAHELGHNLSLFHAPCGGPSGVDRSYPYSDGTLGNWGFDFRDGGTMVQPSTFDLMSYCRPVWISDYHFSNALRYRLFLAREESVTLAAAQKSLLVWGRKKPNGEMMLYPSFVVDAPPVLPESSGEFTLNGKAADGRSLFTVSFDMVEITDVEGVSGFVYLLPIESDWPTQLRDIELSDARREFTTNLGQAESMTMLRSPVNGQVQAFLRHTSGNARMNREIERQIEDAQARGHDVFFSKGMPEASSWQLTP